MTNARKFTDGRPDYISAAKAVAAGRTASWLRAKVNPTAFPEFVTHATMISREGGGVGWTLRNDMVRSVAVMAYRSFLSLRISFESGLQSLGEGYSSQGNIGIMILWLEKLLGLESDETVDILAKFKGMPIRVFFRELGGHPVADNTYIGHFMEDRFLKFSALVRAGLVLNVAPNPKELKP